MEWGTRMGRKRVPDLIIRAGLGHVDKRICGQRGRRSTGTADIPVAERYLARLMEQTRQSQVHGVGPSRTFEQAVAKIVLENRHKRNIQEDIRRLKALMPWIGSVTLDRLHMGSLHPWVAHMVQAGKATGTINHGLQVVRRILNLAAGEWMDGQGPDLAARGGQGQAAAKS
jgi:hypothetical protein